LIDTVTLRDCTLECADNGTTSGSDGFIADVPGTVIEGCKFNLFSKALYLGWATNAVSSIRFVGNIVRGKSAGLLRSLVNTPSVFVGRNRFIGTHTAGLADFLVQTSNTGLVFEDNYFWIPKEAYVDGGSGDRHIAFNCAAKEFRRNEYATDLPANQGGAATAHYAHQYVGSTIAREEKFTGLAPGTADTFRPIFNEAVFNTTNLYNKLHPGANVPGSITRGNQDSTFLPHTWPTAVIYNTALTADRAVTLSTLAGYVFKGARARIIRTAASTGAFNLNVGTGPLKALATGQWCEVEYDGSAWLLTAAGSL
jgi:hypothetical protein